MMKISRKLSGALVVALLAAGISIPAAGGATKKNVAKLTFTATAVDGQAFNSKVLTGSKPSVLWFWAPWCAICQNESKDIVAAAAKYQGKVNFIGVGALGNKEEMAHFIETNGTSNFTNIDDSSGKVWKRFGVILQPTLIFIDKNGTMTTKIGPSDAEYLSAQLKKLTKK
jgi:thiol-disulfide isomerase/thioredoxin